MSSMNGVVTGLVTQVRPGEIRATYPWLDDQHETDWVRIAAPMSGNDRGCFLMPEIGDEVLLAFDQGNPRMPYMIGALWNGKDEPPAKDVRERRITSRNAHSIRFLDSTPSGGSLGALVIEDGHGNRIVMSNGKISIAAMGVLELKAPAVTIQGRTVVPGINPI